MKRQTVQTNVDEETAQRVKAAASENMVSIARIVFWAVRDWLDRYDAAKAARTKAAGDE